jgi:hypothetical protein
MNVVISNKSKIGLGQVVVTKNNPIGKVNFSKVAHLESAVAMADITDVVATGVQTGDILIYNGTTHKYVFQVFPSIDGGTF